MRPTSLGIQIKLYASYPLMLRTICTTVVTFILTHAAYAQPVDRNLDGMGDLWQHLYSISTDDRTRDFDQDGMTNEEEADAGTNPHDPTEHSKLAITATTTNSAAITWFGVLGKRYELEHGPSPTLWSTTGAVESGRGDVIHAALPLDVRQSFVRATQLPDRDSDNDGLADWEEKHLGTDPMDVDSDADGVADGTEFHERSTDPLLPPSIETNPAWETQFSLPPQDRQGWSILTPAPDSRVIYVSASVGDDASGTIYTPSSIAVGANPMQPTGPIQAFQTVTQAVTLLRDGFPDWMLLKRGDEWIHTNFFHVASGRGPSERSVIAYYGSAYARPMIKTGTSTGIRIWSRRQFVALIGVHFYAHGRDPNSPAFLGFDAVTTASGFTCYSTVDGLPNRGILIEDCIFEFYSNNGIQGTGPHDIIVRRCQFLNNYSTTSHSQGMFTHSASILLEENLFDHNGWFKQQVDTGNDKAEGQATYFNHNTYFANTSNTIFRGNIFSRASSAGSKFTANSPGTADVITARNILIQNNLYAEGEVGISAGGNTDLETDFRWENIEIVHNVLTGIGRGRPTNRTLGWGIQANDWDRGRISDNYFMHYGDPIVQNIYGISYNEHGRDVEISGNTFYGLDASKFALRIKGDTLKQNIRIFDNAIQLAETQMQVIDADHLVAGTFSNNVYFTGRTSNEWFRAQGNNVNAVDWATLVSDADSRVNEVAYLDPNRTIETYMATLGHPPSLEAFIQEAKKQSRFNWRPAFTAAAVNRYIRAGFE